MGFFGRCTVMHIAQVRAREWWTYAVIVVTRFVGCGYFLALALGARILDDEDTKPPQEGPNP